MDHQPPAPSTQIAAPQNASLTGKRVLVTGAGRGLGRAIALACGREGAQLALVDSGVDLDGNHPDPAVADAVASEAHALGAVAFGYPLDVGTLAGAREAIARARQDLGPLDALVLSAGIVQEWSLLRFEPQDLDRLLDVYVRGVFVLASEFARQLVADSRPGALLLLCSPVAMFGASRQSGPAAASGAIMGLVRSAAVELRKHDIRINALAPTARTRATAHLPMFQGIDEASMTPAHVSPVATFLLGDQATEISGEIVAVAGSRVYALRGRETTGEVFEPMASPEALAARWRSVVRS